MSEFYLFSYITTFVLGILTLITSIYVGFKRIHSLHILPKALRLYLQACCLPCMFTVTLISIYVAVFYFIFDSQQHWTVEILRTVLAFLTQQIRNCFLFIVLERIYATIRLEKYSLHSEICLFWGFNFASIIISTLYTGSNLYGRFVPGMTIVYELTNHFVFGTHIFIIFACIILHFLNKRMYRVSAYQMTLKRRYTVFENIKVSTFLFPSIIIYVILAQFGAFTSVVFQFYDLPPLPTGFYHIFYNLCFLLIYLRHLSMKQRVEDVNNANDRIIKNPFGKNLPAVVSSEQYFRDLRQTWK